MFENKISNLGDIFLARIRADFDAIENSCGSFVYGIDNHKRNYTFEVNVIKVGDDICVECNGVRKFIPIKRSLWDVITGKSTEEKIRDARQDVFMESYKIYRLTEK